MGLDTFSPISSASYSSGAPGPQGPEGAKGDKGDTGASGPAGATGASALQQIPTGSMKTITSATYEVLSTDTVLVFNRSSAGSTVLVAATGSGKQLMLYNEGEGEIEISGWGTNTVDGDRTVYLYQNESLHLIDYASGKWGVF